MRPITSTDQEYLIQLGAATTEDVIVLGELYSAPSTTQGKSSSRDLTHKPIGPVRVGTTAETIITQGLKGGEVFKRVTRLEVFNPTANTGALSFALKFADGASSTTIHSGELWPGWKAVYGDGNWDVIDDRGLSRAPPDWAPEESLVTTTSAGLLQTVTYRDRTATITRDGNGILSSISIS